MQRIIGGLLYDTDIATKIHVEKETMKILYRTANGKFFTAYPNGEIVVKTEESVKDYLGKYNIDKYIELFGEPQEA